jgi:hypothetical protein
MHINTCTFISELVFSHGERREEFRMMVNGSDVQLKEKLSNFMGHYPFLMEGYTHGSSRLIPKQ